MAIKPTDRLRFGSCLVLAGWLFFQGTHDPKQHRVWAQQPAAAKPPKTEPPRLALLIGVGKYQHLSEGEQLHGCANDVAAMRRLLIDRFRFKESDVKTLIDREATAEAIRKAFKDLVARVKALPADGPEAQVVFHFSGHGSQYVDEPWGHNGKEDGLGETIVPHDATQQGGKDDIRDEEINAFVHQVCDDQKARLLVVLDCCHSGTGARGSTKVRQLPRPDLVPAKKPKDAPPLVPKKLPPGAVFLGACRASEVEPEFQEGDWYHGLLTRFLVEVLSEEKTVSTLSYDLLAKAIVNRYREHRVMQAPTPQLEGPHDALQATVLGAGPAIDRPPYYEVQTLSDSKVRLAAGRFHDVTVGSVFELYANPEDIVPEPTDKTDTSKTVAWLRIASVEGATSEAEVIQWDDGEKKYALAQLPTPRIARGFAVLRHHQRAEPRLRLRVVIRTDGTDGTDGPPLRPDDPAVPPVLAGAIGGAQKKGEVPWLTWSTAAGEPCDLVLRIDGDYAALFPSTGVAEVPARDKSSKVPLSLRGGWGPIDWRTASAAEEVRDYVRRITRATNLLSLAQGGDDAGAASYRVSVEVLAVKVQDNKVLESRPWQPDPKGSITMRKDDGYRVRVTNLQTDGKPVYVTVLLIGPNMEIKVILPDPDQGGEPSKLEPGEHADSYDLKCDADDFGKSHAVLLATREPVNFSFVQQAALPTTRGAPKAGGAAALDQLLQEQTYFTPPPTRSTRLRPTATDTSWHAQVLSWRAVP